MRECRCGRFVRQGHGIGDRNFKPSAATDSNQARADVATNANANFIARRKILSIATANIKN
jgi:hypothetical protein